MQKYILTVRGRRHEWSFTVKGKPEWVDDWRADGLEVYLLEYSIPGWVISAGLGHIWVAGQDALKWLRS